jgi:hypothetical protein
MKLRLLINPFEKIAGFQSLFAGTAGMLIGGIVGYYSNTHFDGILNIHAGLPSPLHVHLAGPFTSVFILGLWFTIFSFIFGKRGIRIVDIFGTQCFAFIPLVPASLMGFSKTIGLVNEYLQQYAANPSLSFGLEPLQLFIFIFMMLAILTLSVWSAIWIYNGFKVASNLKSSILIPVYASGLIISMIVPKIILSLIQ